MSAPKGELRYAFLDIGVGDCTVITWDDSPKNARRARPRCIVVDGGKTKAAGKHLAEYLVDQGVKRIDLLVVTHIDWDHLGGIRALLKATRSTTASGNERRLKAPYEDLKDIPVTHYWGPLPERPGTVGPSRWAGSARAASFQLVAQSSAQNQDLLQALAGRVETALWFPATDAVPDLDLFNNLKLDLLGPREQRYSDEYDSFKPSRYDALGFNQPVNGITIEELNEAIAQWAEARAEQAHTSANNQSIVFSVTPRGRFSAHRRRRLLLTGDAEEDLWSYINGFPDAADRLRADYFKVPHHGAITGLGAGWDRVRPRLSVLSVGQVSYGHPHAPVLQRLRQIGGQIYCTERNSKPDSDNVEGGGAGRCVALGNQCPKAPADGFGRLVVTIGTRRGAPRIAFSGGYCQEQW